MESNTDYKPRTLRSIEMIASRATMLNEAHVQVLSQYVASLRRKFPGIEFPDIDPLDGGCDADILFLLEKPGPQTSQTKTPNNRQGSGFISRDNDDPTAEAILNFMNEAGIHRKRTLLWNVIPGWNGTRKTTLKEIKEGIAELENLLALLPNIQVVVLVGRKAEKAKTLISTAKIIISAHPSPIVRAAHPHIWKQIPSIWKQALQTQP